MFLGLRGGWFLAYYVKAEPQTPDRFHWRFLRFKDNRSEVVKSWCDWSVASLRNQRQQFDCIVRALGSSELVPSGTRPLDTLGRILAPALGGVYAPMILKKLRVTKAMHTLKRAERKAEMRGVYQVANRPADLNGKRVLIIDDITTTNTTIEEILRAMREEWPGAQYFFYALGRTEGDIAANNLITSPYFS